jgi:glyoxylase-like metal-dependent hydrolase (beta-lactamase superfamily II)
MEFELTVEDGSVTKTNKRVQEGDMPLSILPRVTGRLAAEAGRLTFLRNYGKLPFEVIEGERELRPGIRLVFTPGHRPGNQSVAISTAAGWTVITGCCFLAESFTPQKSPAWVTDRVPVVVPSGIHTDMLLAHASMLKVKNLANVIIPFHDPFSPAQMRIAEKKPS